MVHALAPGEVPPVGAHLITPWLGFTHHGIYVGSGKVVHYGALMYDIIRKPVEEVTLDGFAEGRPIYVVEHTEVCFDARRGDSPRALAARREALPPVHQQLRALRRMVHARSAAQLPGGNRAGVSAARWASASSRSCWGSCGACCSGVRRRALRAEARVKPASRGRGLPDTGSLRRVARGGPVSWLKQSSALLAVRTACHRCAGGHAAMAGRQGQRLVRAASLARRQQLHPGRCHQPARDVAGGHLQSRADRQGAGLGPGHRHEHHARVPARPALAAGRAGIHAAHRRSSWRSRRGTASSRCWCSSTPAGIRIPSWGRSDRRSRACTTPAGCRARAARAWPTPPTTRKLKAYVQGVIRAFANDERILGWDLWNEPDNGAGDKSEGEREKWTQVAALLPQVFAWAREANPSQPLTSGVWHNDDWSTREAQSHRARADRTVRHHHVPHL